MVFSSLTFLFCFLPLLLLLYYLAPRNFRNAVLIFFSLLFYAWGGVSYTVILISSILLNYFLVKRIQKTESRSWLVAGIGVNVSLLVVFKYLNFFIDNINAAGAAFGAGSALLDNVKITLPLGISFFTFQQMSMLWDVYRKDVTGKITLRDTALYVASFPQLIAGPIVRYQHIIGQIKDRSESWSLFRSGVERFILGLFKKVVFANTCGALADDIIAFPHAELDPATAWLGMICYALQIYFDFAGYSDMAIGLARMFGFRIRENFDFPYISTSIREFWRRWHISLSTWFRDYLYIPLGGNRAGRAKLYFNLILVFALCGFWHGATWSFVFWGLYHGLFLLLERTGFGNFLNRLPQPISWIYTMGVVVVGWVFFRIEHFGDAWTYAGRMFGFGEPGSISVSAFLQPSSVAIIFLATISSSRIFDTLYKSYLRNSAVLRAKWQFQYLSASGFLFVLLYCILILNAGSFNPFIYFRF